MNRSRSNAFMVLIPFLTLASVYTAQSQTLDNFGVLAGSTVTNTGDSVINGNVGVSPGTAITGFPPGIVTPPFTFYRNDAVAGTAQSDLTTAYNILAARQATVDITGQNLGGLTLAPGVYNAANSSQLTGTLVLDGRGDPNAVFVFKIGSTLTTASASRIELINGAQGGNVYFQVGSSATLGTETAFVGKIFALTSITLNTRAAINCGSALARNGAVTLDSNTISVCVLAEGTYTAHLDTTVTPNELPIIVAIENYIADGGLLPLTFQVLPSVLSPAELAAAIRQLSGEAGTGIAPTGIQAMHSFLSLLLDNVSDSGGVAAPEENPQIRQPGTISVLGYAPVTSTPHGPFSAFEGLRTVPAPAARYWSVWGSAYGGRTFTDGDRSIGSHNRSSQTVGIAAGVDYRITPDTKVGVALGGGTTRFSLSGDLGGGTSDMFQAAIYGRQNMGQAYVTGALAYAWHDVATSRVITLGGHDSLTASFQAYNVAAQLEAGYRFGWFIPYAAIGLQRFTTPSYSERSVSPFALSYDERNAVSTRSQFGFRTEQTFSLSDGAALRLRTRTAWVRDLSEVPYIEAGFQALPGSNFRVKGAGPSRDSLLLSAGAEVSLANGIALSGLFDTQVEHGSRSYSGRAQFRYTW